jgi:hypothetical protein
MPLRASTARSAKTRVMTTLVVTFEMMLLATLLGSGSVLGQVKVRTETIRPPAGATPPPSATQFVPPAQEGNATAGAPQPAPLPQPAPGQQPATGSEIGADLSHLPPAVLRMRERILAAARTGDLQALLAVMKANGSMPVFSHTQRQDPSAYWKDNYPDSDGVEILSILISLLETEPVRIDAGTPQETYLWPYFARLPLKSLTPAQKVELFRVVTGSDYRDMLERGRYVFYQIGIGPDGTWRYFLASE